MSENHQRVVNELNLIRTIIITWRGIKMLITRRKGWCVFLERALGPKYRLFGWNGSHVGFWVHVAFGFRLRSGTCNNFARRPERDRKLIRNRSIDNLPIGSFIGDEKRARQRTKHVGFRPKRGRRSNRAHGGHSHDATRASFSTFSFDRPNIRPINRLFALILVSDVWFGHVARVYICVTSAWNDNFRPSFQRSSVADAESKNHNTAYIPYVRPSNFHNIAFRFYYYTLHNGSMEHGPNANLKPTLYLWSTHAIR